MGEGEDEIALDKNTRKTISIIERIFERTIDRQEDLSSRICYFAAWILKNKWAFSARYLVIWVADIGALLEEEF